MVIELCGGICKGMVVWWLVVGGWWLVGEVGKHARPEQAAWADESRLARKQAGKLRTSTQEGTYVPWAGRVEDDWLLLGVYIYY